MGILQEAKNTVAVTKEKAGRALSGISQALTFKDPDSAARVVLERAKREAQEGSLVEVSLNGQLYRLKETGYDTQVEPQGGSK